MSVVATMGCFNYEGGLCPFCQNQVVNKRNSCIVAYPLIYCESSNMSDFLIEGSLIVMGYGKFLLKILRDTKGE